jgi:hypothetical protein
LRVTDAANKEIQAASRSRSWFTGFYDSLSARQETMLRARLSRLVSAAAPLAFSLARGLLQLSVVRGMLAACLVYVLALRTVAAHLLAVPRGLSAALWRSLLTSQPSSAPSSRSSSPFPSSPNLFASAWRSSSSAAALAHLNRAAASSSLPAPSDFDAALLDPPAYQGKHGNGEELNDNESMSEASWFVEPAGPFSPLLIARTPEEWYDVDRPDPPIPLRAKWKSTGSIRATPVCSLN